MPRPSSFFPIYLVVLSTTDGLFSDKKCSNSLSISLIWVRSDIHGTSSRVTRSNPISDNMVELHLNLENYTLWLPDQWRKHRQARTIVYTHKNLTVKQQRLDDKYVDLPVVMLEVGHCWSKKTKVCGAYREHTGGVSGLKTPEAQMERLERMIQLWKTLTTTEEYLILGDMNVDWNRLSDPDYHNKFYARKIYDFILSENAYQMNEENTREEMHGDELKESNIDHIYTSRPDSIKEIKLQYLSTSDHKIIKFKKRAKTQVKRPNTKRRSYKNFIIEDFLQEILESNINKQTTKSADINKSAETLNNEFNKILNNHAPIKEIKPKKNHCPALQQNTKQDIKCRNSLRTMMNKYGNEEVKEQHKALVKYVKEKVKKDKQMYNENRVNNTDPKFAWRAAKNILVIQQDKTPMEILDDEGKLESNPKKIADVLNDYFLEKTKLIREQMPISQEDPIKRVEEMFKERTENLKTFKLKPISRSKLREILKKVKGGKAAGHHNIDGFSLKCAAPLIEESLLHLINCSILWNDFACIWKHLVLHPQHKKGDKTKKENQRPILYIPEVGKLVERVVAEQITAHMIDKLMSEEQHGTIKDHSPLTAMTCIQDNLMTGADEKTFTSILLIDLTAAYDLIDHEILDKKLKVYKFDESTRVWIKNYLAKRTQCVEIGGMTSNTRYLEEYGAPQGSIMAGLLYLIYANDIPNEKEDKKSILYVDDTTNMQNNKINQDIGF